MKRILVFGAGKSATALIDYLIENAGSHNWLVVIADRNLELVEKKIEGRKNAEALAIDILNAKERVEQIQQAHFVISMLPASLHIHVAKDCIAQKTDLVTASYVSEEINKLDQAAKDAGVLLMNEMGADPGLDHMSAMEMIERVRRQGGTVTSFQSYCGGLVAPESDTNPWHYKVAWNPWNIVRAGATGADFLMNGEKYHRTYENLYRESNIIEVPGYGSLAAYANRDSLKYIDDYNLKHAHTVLRATLRHPDFMNGWAALVDLGLTNDRNEFDVTNMTFKTWFMQVTKSIAGKSLSEKLNTIGLNGALSLLENLEITSNEKINIEGVQSPGKVLQSILVKKWELEPTDKDLLVFHHDLEYEIDGDSYQLESTMLVKGENQTDTAMAKCVGLPMAVFTKLFLTNKIAGITGVQIPTMKKVYEPMLAELKKLGIEFEEK